MHKIGLYTISPVPISCGVWHKKGGSVGGRILRNGRAIAYCNRVGFAGGEGNKLMIDFHNKALKWNNVL